MINSMKTFPVIAFCLIAVSAFAARPTNDVNVTNQSLDVNVINEPSVQINNSSNNPIPVNTVNVPFRKFGNCILNSLFNSCQSPFEPPPGKLLIIETISAQATIPTGHRLHVSFQTGFGEPAQFASAFLPMTYQNTFASRPAGTFDVFHGLAAVKMYATEQILPNLAGVLISASRENNQASTVVVGWSVHGYVVDCPTSVCPTP